MERVYEDRPALDMTRHNESEAAEVRLWAGDLLSGVSMNQVLRDLAARGVPTVAMSDERPVNQAQDPAGLRKEETKYFLLARKRGATYYCPMKASLGRRAPTAAELSGLCGKVIELAGSLALKLSVQEPESTPFRLSDEHLTDGPRCGCLVRAAVLDALLNQVREAVDDDVLLAMDHGATFADVGDALGISRQAAGQRFRSIRSGKKVAVVISRRDKVHMYPNDPRGKVGEVGGPDQLDSDQGIWPVGAVVRALAKYSIVAVDSIVRRVYLLDPEGWHEVEPNKWKFTAVNGRELDPEEIAAAYAAGDLPLRPGDDCPTRAGGAYRPHWF